MRLAFLIHNYVPQGGLQRDLRLFVALLHSTGHYCRIYAHSWQPDTAGDVDVRLVPSSGLRLHVRSQRFQDWVLQDLARDPVDGVIGCNKMPGLDVCFAREPCYVEQVSQERGKLFRRSAQFKHFAACEQAVFGAQSDTRILLVNESEKARYQQHYATNASRMIVLSPGVSVDRRAGDDAPDRRRAMRENLGLAREELALLFVASDFIGKGLDRVITTLANAREAQPSEKVRLLVVGQDNNRSIRRQVKKLGVEEHVEFLGGRDDIPDLMLAADLLVHPVRHEATGAAVLEAIVAGLPVVTSVENQHAQHVRDARAGIVLESPFTQEALDRAVMRCIDGVYRAECRRSALHYSEWTDLYSMHRMGADLILEFIRQKVRSSNA